MEEKLKFTKEQLTKPGSQGNVFKTKKDLLQMAQTYFNERWDQKWANVKKNFKETLSLLLRFLKLNMTKLNRQLLCDQFFLYLVINFGFLFGHLG